MPRFSIVISCYNQRDYISAAVRSALSQHLGDREVIVVDDGSTDRSVDILRGYRDAINLQVAPGNIGVCGARNLGVSVSHGEYLVFLDGDDMLLPWALDVYNRVIDLRSPRLLLGSMVWFKGEQAPPVPFPSGPIRVVEYGNYRQKDRSFRASASAMIVRRGSFDEVGGWTDGMYPMSDQDLLLKLCCCGKTVQILHPVTTAYRIHGKNIVSQMDRMVGHTYKLIQRERSGAYPGGKTRRLARYSIVGGVVFSWAGKLWRAHRPVHSIGLLAHGLPMVMAAIVRRLRVIVTGRRPVLSLGEIPRPD